MKKVIVILFVSLAFAASLFAIDGYTTVQGAYTYNNGKHYIGLASNSLGYGEGKSIGYYAGVDAAFNAKDIGEWNIGLLVGPSYRYAFGESGVVLNAALGVSGMGAPSYAAAGVGGYVGVDWKLNDGFGFALGAKVGNDFLVVPFDGSGVHLENNFFVTPSLGVSFFY